MGSGASKQRHSSQLISASRPRSPEPSSSKNVNITQPKVPVQDQRLIHDTVSKSREKEEINLPQGDQANADWDVLHSETLQKYKANYPDQAESLQEMFDRIQALKSFVNSILNQPDQDCKPDKYYKVVAEILSSLVTQSLNLHETQSVSVGTSEAAQLQLTTLMDFVVDIEGAEALKQFAQHCFHKCHDQFKEELEETDETDDEDDSDRKLLDYALFHCLHKTLVILQNFCDIYNEFCSACANAGIVTMCLENIKRIDAENSNWKKGRKPVIIITACTEMLHNISRRLRDRKLFANSEETLLYFAKVTDVPRIASASLLCLAYLVNEETQQLSLEGNEDLLRFMIQMLHDACQKSEYRNSNGYSAKELAEGLSHLAINDKNKKVLGRYGAVGVLISALKTSNEDEEKASAARALWMLAFDDNNKEIIRQEEGGLEVLHQLLQHSEDPEVKVAADGALWELEGRTTRDSNTTVTTGNHVMISYQWDSQDVLIEVKKRLKDSGYKVWMDVDQMRGSTLESMAKAVENASVVLVCVSERYKESPNCRSEAQYAYDKRKDIIPLMMQRNYKADGWLGIIVAAKLWIDFRSKYVFDAGVRKLIKELGGRGRDVDMTDGPSQPVVRAVQANVVATTPSTLAISSWTNKEVKQWLKEIGLEKVCKGDISKMNGQTLIDLQELRVECPDYFYKCVEQILKLTDMYDLLEFRRGLSRLFGY